MIRDQHRRSPKEEKGVMPRTGWLSLQSDIIIASVLPQQRNQKIFTIFFLKKDYQHHKQ